MHISDLHCSRTVSTKYLRHCIERVNIIDPDMVVLTGDYITYDLRGKFTEKVVNLIAKIKSRFGVYACMGNHDYGIGSVFGSWRDDLLHDLIDGMKAKGVNVLRNEAVELEIDGQPLWMVGLGDYWVKDFQPEKAFAKIPEEHPAIALLHNPDGAKHLKAFPADAVMSGHTHGLNARLVTSPGPKITRRCYHAGMYNVHGKKLYVNRGLGRLGRSLFNARPEITIFTLR